MYEDRYVRRGEIYAIKSGSFNEPDSSMSRPGLIISSKTMNDSANAVIVAMLTTTENNIGIHYGPIMNTGRKSYVCCERLLTVDKVRIGRLMGELSENQMKEVESRLDEVLDLGYVDDAPLKEKEVEVAALNIQVKELREEVAKMKAQIAAHDNDDTARRVEIEMWQRLYEKALDQVCTMKLTGDVARRGGKKLPAEEIAPKAEEKPVKFTPVVEDEPKLVDINTAKFDELKKCGLNDTVVLAIISCRPFASVKDLKKVPGVTNVMYGIISKKVCCSKEEAPKKPASIEPKKVEGKVNVNLVKTAQELTKLTGMCMRTTNGIIKYREEHGKFTCLDDLLKTPAFGKIAMGRYGHLLEV